MEKLNLSMVKSFARGQSARKGGAGKYLTSDLSDS